MERIPVSQSESGTESLEKKTSRLRSALFAAFLATMPTTAEAVEFKDASWKGGLAQMIRLVFARNEHAAMAVHAPGKKAMWVNGREGTELAVKPIDEQKYQADEQRDIDTVLEAAVDSGDGVVRICHTHTHPAHVFKNQGGKPKYALGPSVGDLHHLFKFKSKLKEFALDARTETIGLALGSWGGWYYNINDIKLLEGNLHKVIDEDTKINHLHQELTLNLGSGKPDFRLASETIRLLENEYRQYGIGVRHVTFKAMLEEEPECAGPDYVPSAPPATN